jgi:hypothetical protein
MGKERPSDRIRIRIRGTRHSVEQFINALRPHLDRAIADMDQQKKQLKKEQKQDPSKPAVKPPRVERFRIGKIVNTGRIDQPSQKQECEVHIRMPLAALMSALKDPNAFPRDLFDQI